MEAASEQTPGMRATDDGTLVLSGDVEETVLGQLREHLERLLAAHSVVRVDLSAVDFLPSAAIGVIMGAAGRARSRGLELAVVAVRGTRAARILDVTGVSYVSPDALG